MSQGTRNLLILHFIVFIWGWTAVLGKIITLPALQLIWIRVIIAFAGILIYVLIKRVPLFSLSTKTILQLFAIGNYSPRMKNLPQITQINAEK